MALTVKPADPIGAELLFDSIEQLLTHPDVPGEVMAAVEQHGVVFFREVGFNDQQQVDFGTRLGELVQLNVGRVEGSNPEIYHVGFGDGINNLLYVKGAFSWHLDGSSDAIPPKGSLLSARQLADEGGDTQFVSTYQAYDRLSPQMKELAGSLRVVHTIESAYRLIDPDPTDEVLERLRKVGPRVHPLVWTHRDGRKSLVLGATASGVEGMAEAEGAALIDQLMADATAPGRVYTHHWHLGDLVFWDNRGTMHRATHYAEDSGRSMHRVTLVGDEPIE